MAIDRIKWIEHKGKRILYVDLSGLHHDRMTEVVNSLEPFYKNQPKNSILTLADYSNSYGHSGTYRTISNILKDKEPYDLKSACVGMSTAKKIFLKLIIRFYKKNIKLFDEIEEAKDWLVS